MKNRVLGLAIAAMALSPVFVGKAPMQVRNVSPTPNVAGGGTTLPQGGIGTMLGDIVRQSGGGGAGFVKPRYKKRTGWSMAEGKRRARRARNRMRAKGQFRKAVR